MFVQRNAKSRTIPNHLDFYPQWDHTDNEIIAAAKKIAYLMAHLSELMNGGTKKELLACAKGLAEVSERITELSKELAKQCTDKKIRTNLLQVRD